MDDRISCVVAKSAATSALQGLAHCEGAAVFQLGIIHRRRVVGALQTDAFIDRFARYSCGHLLDDSRVVRSRHAHVGCEGAIGHMEIAVSSICREVAHLLLMMGQPFLVGCDRILEPLGQWGERIIGVGGRLQLLGIRTGPLQRILILLCTLFQLVVHGRLRAIAAVRATAGEHHEGKNREEREQAANGRHRH